MRVRFLVIAAMAATSSGCASIMGSVDHLPDRSYSAIYTGSSCSTFYRWRFLLPANFQILFTGNSNNKIPMPHSDFKAPRVVKNIHSPSFVMR